MDLYSKTLTAIAKRSLKEEINLFEKMDMWLNFLDESEQNGNVDNLEMSTLLMKQKQAEVATEWKAAVEAGTWFVAEQRNQGSVQMDKLNHSGHTCKAGVPWSHCKLQDKKAL